MLFLALCDMIFKGVEIPLSIFQIDVVEVIIKQSISFYSIAEFDTLKAMRTKAVILIDSL